MRNAGHHSAQGKPASFKTVNIGLDQTVDQRSSRQTDKNEGKGQQLSHSVNDTNIELAEAEATQMPLKLVSDTVSSSKFDLKHSNVHHKALLSPSKPSGKQACSGLTSC